MAADSDRIYPSAHHKSPASFSSRNQSVSAMIKQGFISDPILSPSRHSPPPTFGATANPTLFEMMASEHARDPNPPSASQKKLQERVSEVLSYAPFRICNLWGVGDVRLTLGSRVPDGDTAEPGYRVTVDVHRRVLAARSRFFAERLGRSGPHTVEILECDDVAVYLEAVVLMYSDQLKIKLLGRDVPKTLALLKICSAIMFEDGVKACLEYLEAVPWSEDEQESVVSHLNELQFDSSRTDSILERVIAEPSTPSRADEVFLKLSMGLLQAKDEKARKEMKSLIFQLLREDNDRDKNRIHVSRDTMYHICHRSLSSLVLCLSGATSVDENNQNRGSLMAEIAREADNIQWIVGILIDRKMGEAFVKLWADQKELAVLHSKIPTVYRHEISKITAQLCISIGKGQVLVPKETRFSLLSTWLEALYDDFTWMRNAGKSIDKKMIEEGLCQTILTLPLSQQQSILLSWFDRYLNRGDDCPNIQNAFQIWWRRAFLKHYSIESQMQLAVYDAPH